MTKTISLDVRSSAIELLRASGIGTSDCQLVHVGDDVPGWLELRSASGRKTLAIVILSLAGQPLSVVEL